MEAFVFTILLANFWTIISCEDGLSTNVLQPVKEVLNTAGSTEEPFINTRWTELSKFLPDSAKVPGIGITLSEPKQKILIKPEGAGEFWKTDYMCAVESKIYPKLGAVISTKVQKKKAGRKFVEVIAEINMVDDNHPMDLKLYKKIGKSDDVLGPVNVKLTFPQKSKVKLILDIPDVSTQNIISYEECLVKIINVDVTELSMPDIVGGSDDEKNIVSKYWQIVSTMKKNKFMNDMMSVALRRAIYTKLSEEKKGYWICPSKELTKKFREGEKEYSYKDIYIEFCRTTGTKEEAFINTRWPELTNILPGTATFPGIELGFYDSFLKNLYVKLFKKPRGAGKYWNVQYICSMESQIYPKLGEVIYTKVQKKKKDRTIVEVKAEISMADSGNFMDLKIYKKIEKSDDVRGPIDVQFNFPKKSIVKLILDIPDVSRQNIISNDECLVKIISVDIPKLSKPGIVNYLDEENQNIALDYWEYCTYKTDFMNEMMSVALRRAIYEKLSEEKKGYWICPTQELKKKFQEGKKEYEYADIYREVCKNE